MAGLRQDLAARRQQQPLSSQLEYDTWVELLIKTNHNSFGRHSPDMSFGPWVRRPLPSPAAADDCDPLPPPPQRKETAGHQPDDSGKQRIESYRQEIMQMVRNMPKEEAEDVAAFELSFRDIVESPPTRKIQPEVAVAAAGNMEKKSKLRRESRSKNRGASGLFIIKEFMPLLLAAVRRHRKIAGGGVEKAAKVSPNPCQANCEERSCSSGSSNRSGGSRNSRRMVSCSFLH